MTRVVHCKKEKYDVYIGRPSKWANPFIIGRNGNREEVIQKYKSWIMNQPHLLADLYELEGKALGCWCKPLPCHGDILVELLNTQVYCTHCAHFKIKDIEKDGIGFPCCKYENDCNIWDCDDSMSLYERPYYKIREKE